jgi:hypothetical protein
VLGKFGLCLKLISEIEGLEWSVCFEILEPPSLVIGDGGSKISKQTNHSKPSISLISFRHKLNFPNTTRVPLPASTVTPPTAHVPCDVGPSRCHQTWASANGIQAVFDPTATLLKTPRPPQMRNSSHSQPLQDCCHWHHQPPGQPSRPGRLATWPQPCAVGEPQLHSIVAPGSLSDAMTSSQGGAPSRSQVAALFRGACSMM